MAKVDEIRNMLAHYLAGDMPLSDFEDWFVQNSWNAQDEDLETRSLVHGVELRLSEYSSGHLAIQDLHKELKPLASEHGSVVFKEFTAPLELDVKWLGVGQVLFAWPAAPVTVPGTPVTREPGGAPLMRLPGAFEAVDSPVRY